MARTILIGDVHGCRNELDALLDQASFAAGDRVVLVGDLVARGPDSRGVLALVRQIGARSVRGNHEEKLLSWRREHGRSRDLSELGASHRKVVRELDDEDWDFLASFPLYLDLDQHRLRVVHAGVLPNVPIDEQSSSVLLKLRSLGPNGEPLEVEPNDREAHKRAVLWGARYEGPPHVVFGHNARLLPQLHPGATGLDTAAVYGGRLTALVLGEGEEVPPLSDRIDALVTVAARERYHPHPGLFPK